MGRVITNGMSLSFAREAALGVLPATPQWFLLEPNAINAFGVTTAKTTRSPISRARARRKGVVTDQDSNVEIAADLTLQHLRLFAEAFCFARAIGGDAYLTSAAAAGGYTVAAISGTQAGKLIYSAAGAKTLIAAQGFTTPANNGLKVLGGAVAAGAVLIPAAGLVAENPDPSVMAEVAVAGVRAAAGDLRIDANGNIVSTALDFTTLGVAIGQVIHLGGPDVTHQFFNVSNYGFARVVAVAPHLLTLAKRSQPYAVDDGTSTGAGGTPVAVDLLFGQFVCNVSVDSPDFLAVGNQFELASPNLMPGGVTGFEYAIGNWANALSVAIPATGKATITLGFVGMNVTKPSTVRANLASQAKVGGQTEAFGTSSDIARIRVEDVDETGLTTDFKSATFTLTNSVTGEKVLGHLGPKFLNIGDFQADVQNELLFTNPDVIDRIRCNKTVGFDWALRNADGGVVFDLPTGTLTGGNRNYPANQSVTMQDTFAAHQEDEIGFTVGISFFPILPAIDNC